MARGRHAGLTEIETALLRAGLVASVRGGQGHFWAYEVQQVFKDIAGRAISWGTLFPALRRLELMGYLTSEWSSPNNGKRPIRYYHLTEPGIRECVVTLATAAFPAAQQKTPQPRLA